MDTGAIIIAGLGLVGSAALGAAGNAARVNHGARTASRLIYAELTKNIAPVRYYMRTKSWPDGIAAHAAWDAQAEALAKVRGAEAFVTIYRGYAALDGIAFIADGATPIEDDRGSLLEAAIQDVSQAVRAVGQLARIEPAKLDEQLREVEKPQERGDETIASAVGEAPPSVPWYVLERAAAEATGAQQRAAEQTIASMRAERDAARQVPSEGNLRRKIRDARHTEDVAGAVTVRAEGDPPTGDEAVDETYVGLGETFRFFSEVYGRELIDGRGGDLEAIVQYGTDFINCFWDGERLIVGDGDGGLFNRFSSSIDVIAHEITHGIVEAEAHFQYSGQTGALIESLCDVFGSLVKQYARGETVDQADWLVGAEILGPNVKGRGLRSLAEPGSAYDDAILGQDPQPADMDDYVHTTQANDGALINCGIPNRAFYLVAVALGGHAWEQAGRFWYEALVNERPSNNEEFLSFGRLTERAAERLYGADSPAVDAVRAGWEGVGVPLRATSD